MEYAISRSSSYDAKPCDEAYQRAFVSVDRRTFKTPQEHDERLREKWTDRGRNHRIEGDGIARDFDAKGWFIDVPDLLAFVQKYGEIVLSVDDCQVPPIPSIEIYDSYRE